jgi:hypothetical protein
LAGIKLNLAPLFPTALFLQGVFHTSTMSNRTFINHHGMSLFDPLLDAAIYDMRAYEKHPGDSYLFK